MRSALKARDERLQMMLAGIAHEVRNPLGGLELYAGLLRDALQDRPERLEEVRRIEREINYLKVVVTEFLDYARRPAPELGSVRLFELLDEVRELVTEGGVAVTVACPPDIRVRADAGQLRRALLNLARNAVAAAQRRHPGGGEVLLRARATERACASKSRYDGAGGRPTCVRRSSRPSSPLARRAPVWAWRSCAEIVADHGRHDPGRDAAGGGARFFFALATTERESP